MAVPLMLSGAVAAHVRLSGGIWAPALTAAVHVIEVSPSATSGALQLQPEDAVGARTVDL
jgi:hypothetical protein